MDVVKLRGIAAQLLFKHGLRSWSFGLANTGRRLGVCKYNLSLIEISEHYARNSPEANVMDTLLHEIAHALTPGSGHGPAWKAMAIKLGATPRSCDSSEDTVQRPGDWQAKCPACGKVWHKYRRPRHLTGYRCKCAARCSVKFEYAGDPALKPVGVPLTPQEAAFYQAVCPGCGTVHKKANKPRRSLQCRCRRSGVLVWKLVQPVAANRTATPTTVQPLTEQDMEWIRNFESVYAGVLNWKRELRKLYANPANKKGILYADEMLRLRPKLEPILDSFVLTNPHRIDPD